MAMINIKTEIITPFGGILQVRELFFRYVGPVIDEVLGLHCASFDHQYNEIVGAGRSFTSAAVAVLKT